MLSGPALCAAYRFDAPFVLPFKFGGHGSMPSSLGIRSCVQLGSAGSSKYQMRKEPRPECLSTMEAVAYALPFLEPGDAAAAAAAHLQRSFQLMVGFQMQWINKRLEQTRLTPSGSSAVGTGTVTSAADEEDPSPPAEVGSVTQ